MGEGCYASKKETWRPSGRNVVMSVIRAPHSASLGSTAPPHPFPPDRVASPCHLAMRWLTKLTKSVMESPIYKTESPPARKPLPRVWKPNLHSDRGQNSNPCAWRPLGAQSTQGSTVP
ncbi:hypothetical protein E2C01_047041 [Portunus trituberculatus]|uniref:Uncharacterized protein n=1 Tax=Portunus trituberculatus TaxID=210409 RepID=A0A5B7G6V6_PORTR|nr:hypothetical protein [Portunus trituberculatus]